MLAKEVVAAVVQSGDVVFVEAAWDVLLRCAYIIMLQYAVYVASASPACGFGRPGVLLSACAVNYSQLAFHKYQLSAEPAMAL